jgi:hypothetical protein
MLSTVSPAARKGIIAGCATLGVVGLHAGAAAFFASHDPYGSSVFPPCPFLFLTGWQCPGCGGTRATYSLFQGDIAQSWRMNPLIILGYPIGLLLAGSITAKWASHPRLATVLTRIALGVLAGVVVYNWVVRNVLAGLA